MSRGMVSSRIAFADAPGCTASRVARSGWPWPVCHYQGAKLKHSGRLLPASHVFHHIGAQDKVVLVPAPRVPVELLQRVHRVACPPSRSGRAAPPPGRKPQSRGSRRRPDAPSPASQGHRPACVSSSSTVHPQARRGAYPDSGFPGLPPPGPGAPDAKDRSCRPEVPPSS